MDKFRSHLGGEGEKETQWKLGYPPNYDVVNKLFEDERTKKWPIGSLEERVERLIKTFEMELVHKVRPQDWKSINKDKFRLSLNGRESKTPQELKQIGGNYNFFLQTSLPEDLRGYDSTKETTDSSETAFMEAFPRGFALEVLEVFAGPPKIVFKFRHWAYMEGPFLGHAPTGEKVELQGIGIFQAKSIRYSMSDYYEKHWVQWKREIDIQGSCKEKKVSTWTIKLTSMKAIGR